MIANYLRITAPQDSKLPVVPKANRSCLHLVASQVVSVGQKTTVWAFLAAEGQRRSSNDYSLEDEARAGLRPDLPPLSNSISSATLSLYPFSSEH